jgi:type IV secretion system protein VirB10
VAAVAGLMVCVMFLTGREAPPAAATKVPTAPATVDPNQVRIQEYRDRVEEQARRLQAEQAELAMTKHALATAARPPSTTGAGASDSPAASQSVDEPAAAWQQDQAQREYRALYADNLAWTARSTSSPAPARPEPHDQPAVTAPAAAATASLVAQLQAAAASVTTAAGTPQPPATTPAPASPPSAKPSEPTKVAADGSARNTGPTYVLLEGTIIEAVLANRLDGSYASPVIALVTTPVYARDFQHVVIPAGSRLLGSATPVSEFGQQRLAVAFHRVVFPNSRFATLDKFQGLNQVGDTGLRDEVNHHYLQAFGASLAIGALAGFAQQGTRVGFDEPWTDTYRQGVSSSVAQSSMRVLDRFLNRLPTITIREGHRVKIYLSADLSLPEYRDGGLAPAPIR